MTQQERQHQKTDLAKRDSPSDPLHALLRLLAGAVASRLVRSAEQSTFKTNDQTTKRADAPRSRSAMIATRPK